MILFDELHFCHPFAFLALTAARATASRSSLSHTINASFPPSSNTAGFRFFHASDPSACPANSQPVRFTHFTSSLDNIYSDSRDEMIMF
jgi:hypothetical protein